MKHILSMGCLQLGLALTLGSAAYAQIAATTLCSTGRTPKSISAAGCLLTVPVSPVNPVDGGPIVDGNWDLAVPYPSRPAHVPAPNPCSFPTIYSPAPVSAAEPEWFNPNDQISQWIEPLGGGSTPPGWYIYETRFVAPESRGNAYYRLEIPGQILVDNSVPLVYVRSSVDGVNVCGSVAAFPKTASYSSWTPFHFSTTMDPGTVGYLYAVVYNDTGSNINPTGLRVEFSDPAFYPF